MYYNIFNGVPPWNIICFVIYVLYRRAPPPPVALASHVGHRGLEVTVHRPVLGSLGQQWSTIDPFSVLFSLIKRRHLVVAEGDGEPSIVAVDDLNAVVSRAAAIVFD